MLWAPDPFNRRTGKLLGYNYFQVFSDYDPAKGGDYFRRVMRQPGKKMLTEEGQIFANWIKGLGEEVDSITPWLIKQFKDGNIGLTGEGEVSVKNNAGETQTVPMEAAEEVFGKFATWYNATDSPYRQGQNIQEMSLEDVNSAATQHYSWVQQQESEKQRKEELQEIMDEGNARQNTVYEWPDGWTVKRLDSPEDLELESDAMDHCIGNDDQPYCEALYNGRITVYSLRDPDGLPHATWHYNPDGSLAQIQGYQGHSLKDEYWDRFEQWANQAGMPTDTVGDQMHEPEVTIRIVTVPDFINTVGGFTHETYDDFREWAESEGAYVNDETEYNVELDWNSIISGLIRSHQSYIDSARQTWTNEWGEAPTGPMGVGKRDPQPNLFDYPPSTSLYGYPRQQDFNRVFDDFFTALTGQNSSSERWDHEEFNPKTMAQEFNQALSAYRPSANQKEGYEALVQKWDEIQNQLTEPETGQVDFYSIAEDPDTWPGNEWSRDPQNQPPLWIDKGSDVEGAHYLFEGYTTPEGFPQAIPWWYSDKNSPYSEETFLPTPEYNDKKKVWNRAARKQSNDWEDIDTKPRVEPNQLPLPGMCPNCGSADYEIGWKTPTQTTQNMYDMSQRMLQQDPDQEHPFTRGWYYYCPDCNYYEGYTGPAVDAREQQIKDLRRWRRERRETFSPSFINDPLLWDFNKNRYEHEVNWHNQYRREGEPPNPQDYGRGIEVGRGAPRADMGRKDPFYEYTRNMLADPESSPNLNIKQPNYKSVLKRLNETVENAYNISRDSYSGDYTSQALVDFAVKMGQTDKLTEAAKSIIDESNQILSQVPNIGVYRWDCNCPNCNRKRGQQNRWKDKLIVKEIKEQWKNAYKAEQERFRDWRKENPRRHRKHYLNRWGRGEYIRDENGNVILDPETGVYKRKQVTRFEHDYPQFRGMSYREIMRQDPDPEEVESKSRYWKPDVEHPAEDHREQWAAFTEATGVGQYGLKQPKSLKARAQWVLDQLQSAMTRDPSTPSDPS